MPKRLLPSNQVEERPTKRTLFTSLRKGIHINDLPDEILDHIFGFVPFSGQNWLSVLCVCKLWRSVGIETFNPAREDNFAIRWASEHGKVELVQSLLLDARVDPSAKNDSAIISACMRGHLGVVTELLKHPRVNPKAHCHWPFRWASCMGHIDIVRQLLKDSRADPAACSNSAIRWASMNGHLEVVKLLLQDERVDPSDLGNSAIRWARENGHFLVVQELEKDHRVLQAPLEPLLQEAEETVIVNNQRALDTIAA